MAISIPRNSKDRYSYHISRNDLAIEIGAIIGNPEGTFGLRQFYKNPHISIIALELHDLELSLTGVLEKLGRKEYVPSMLSADLEKESNMMSDLRRRCIGQKSSSYTASNRYLNESQNPWTQISSFLSSSLSELDRIRENIIKCKAFST